MTENYKVNKPVKGNRENTTAGDEAAPVFADCETLARMLAIAPKTVRKWTASGFLPCVRVSARCVRYPIKDCLAIFEAHRIKALSEV